MIQVAQMWRAQREEGLELELVELEVLECSAGDQTAH